MYHLNPETNRYDQRRVSKSQGRPPIIIFTHEFFPKKAGISVFVNEMAQALHQLGLDVEAFVPSHPELNDLHFPYKVNRLGYCGSQGWLSRLISGIELIRIRKRLDNSILYLPEPGPIRLLMYLRLLPFINPKKLILTLHGSDINRTVAFPHRKVLFGKLLKQCHQITVPSNYTRHLLISHFPAAENKIVVTPLALRSSLKVLQKPAVKKNDKLIVITVARIHPRKGQDVVLESMASLSPEMKGRITYRMIGPVIDQKYLSRLRNMITTNAINAEISGEMEDEELARAYQQADLFVMTSRPHQCSVEGFGLSYLEASANGLPILAHKTGGVEDAVKDGVSGLLAEPGDRVGLITALKRLIVDANLRNSLGRGGRQWVQRFSWEKTARAIVT